jgi:hypothetical protein
MTLAEVVRLLEESVARFESVAAEVATPLAASGSGWTALEITEHLVLTEEQVSRLVRTVLLRSPEKEPNPTADAVLVEHLPDRGGAAQRRESPERVRPAGRYQTMAEALAALREARQSTVAWVKTADEEKLRRHRLPHPVFGELDGVQWVLFLALHCERHARQAEELRAAKTQSAPL